MKTIMIEIKHIIKAAMILATLFTVLSVWAGKASAVVVAPADEPAVASAPVGLGANAIGVRPVGVNPLGFNPAAVHPVVGVNPVIVNRPVFNPLFRPIFNPFLFRPIFNPFFIDVDDIFGFGFGAVLAD